VSRYGTVGSKFVTLNRTRQFLVDDEHVRRAHHNSFEILTILQE
jgi:hypothetical protein